MTNPTDLICRVLFFISVLKFQVSLDFRFQVVWNVIFTVKLAKNFTKLLKVLGLKIRKSLRPSRNPLRILRFNNDP